MRKELKITTRVTPTSAMMASQSPEIPTTPRVITKIFTPRAMTMFCVTRFPVLRDRLKAAEKRLEVCR